MFNTARDVSRATLVLAECPSTVSIAAVANPAALPQSRGALALTTPRRARYSMLDAPVADVGDVEAGGLGVKPLYARDVPKQVPLKTRLYAATMPLRYVISLSSFLLVIVYMLFVGIFQGAGMLGMYWVMPSFMKLVYPSRVGQLHSWFLGVYRKCFMGEEGHSRSIRIDLDAADSSSAPQDSPPRGGDGTSAAAGAATRGGAGEAAIGSGSVGPLHPYSVHTVACLADNYAYVIVDRSAAGSGQPYPAALVDPCDGSAVLTALAKLGEEEYQSGLHVEAILTTHHHWDHAGGNRFLAKQLDGPIRIYGGKDDVVAGCTHKLADGDMLRVGNLTVRALHAPCHTRGSICFVIEGPTPSLFGGDTLFCGGCGAPFEGTQQEMSYNFGKIWRLCPLNTLVFPGHEYSTTILPGYFSGQSPLPEHPAAFSKLCSVLWRCQQLRSYSSPVPTVPLVLADELVINSNFNPLRKAAETLVHAYLQHLAFAWHQQAQHQHQQQTAALARLQQQFSNSLSDDVAISAAARLFQQVHTQHPPSTLGSTLRVPSHLGTLTRTARRTSLGLPALGRPSWRPS